MASLFLASNLKKLLFGNVWNALSVYHESCLILFHQSQSGFEWKKTRSLEWGGSCVVYSGRIILHAGARGLRSEEWVLLATLRWEEYLATVYADSTASKESDPAFAPYPITDQLDPSQLCIWTLICEQDRTATYQSSHHHNSEFLYHIASARGKTSGLIKGRCGSLRNPSYRLLLKNICKQNNRKIRFIDWQKASSTKYVMLFRLLCDLHPRSGTLISQS